MAKDPTESRTRPALGNNLADRGAAIARSVVGLAPIAGPMLAELLTAVIPNQRLDRVEAFLGLLAHELETLGASVKAVEPSSVPLVEEGIAQAARAFSTDRREFLAKCVAKGISADEQDRLRELKILQILGELGDDDLLLLDAHVEPGGFQKRRSLAPDHAFLSDTDDVKAAHQLHSASFRRLEAMSLLNFHATHNRDGQPEYERDGQPKGSYGLTSLGRVLLARVGLGSPEAIGGVA